MRGGRKLGVLLYVVSQPIYQKSVRLTEKTIQVGPYALGLHGDGLCVL